MCTKMVISGKRFGVEININLLTDWQHLHMYILTYTINITVMFSRAVQLFLLILASCVTACHRVFVLLNGGLFY